MRAIVQDRYGPPELLRVAEVEKPTPREGEVLVRVRAASVHPDVWHVVTGLPYALRFMGAGVRKPKNPVPGTDLAGVVESLGEGVTRFRPEDEVFGETIRGMQWVNGGAFAEYAVAPESGLAHKPAGVSFEQAAAVPTAGLIALPVFAEANVRAGHHVLINGAAGGVGTIVAQLAKAEGAEVTGVDRGDRFELMRRAGIDRCIDFEREDFTRGADRYDAIVDIPGNHSLSACLRVLRPEGKYVLVGHDNYGRGMKRGLGLIPRMFRLMLLGLFVKKLPRPHFALPDKAESMRRLTELLAEGKLTPQVDRRFALEEVAQAIRYLEGGRAQGRVVVVP